MEDSTEKPNLQLAGLDANALAVLDRAQRAAREAGWPKEKIREVMDEAMSGDYDHLLSVMTEYFDVS